MPKLIPFDPAAVLSVIRPIIDDRPIRYTIEELRSYIAVKLGAYQASMGRKLGPNRAHEGIRRDVVLRWAGDFMAGQMDREAGQADHRNHYGGRGPISHRKVYR